jgi:hypothetical protein
MSVLSKLASVQDRRDEEPNKALGRALVESRDVDGIREVAENLWNADRRIRIDCLSVLEQIGLLEPALIEHCVADFLKLAFSKDNRLVWAAMINLALIADRKPDEIFEWYNELVGVIEKGSVITKDNGIKTLATVASVSAEYGKTILPYLMAQLRTCRAKSVPQYAESIRIAVGVDDREEYVAILNERLDELSAVQQRRVNKLLRSF